MAADTNDRKRTVKLCLKVGNVQPIPMEKRDSSKVTRDNNSFTVTNTDDLKTDML